MERAAVAASPPVARTAAAGAARHVSAPGPANDRFECEADAAAACVMGSRRPRLAQLPAEGGAATVPAIADAVLRSPGRPLDVATRRFFEPRFGRDFGQVRVHDDGSAARSAAALHARAYAAGSHLVFAAGQHDPGSPAGRTLLAHELAHVVQQSGVAPRVQRQDADAAPQAPAPLPPREATPGELGVIDAARRAALVRAQLALVNAGGNVPEGRHDPGERMRERARLLAARLLGPQPPSPEQVDRVLRDIVAQLVQPEVRVAAEGDPACGERAGYVPGLAPPVVLCPAFFSDSAEQQVRTMLHEAAHLVGIGDPTGEGYCPMYDCESDCGGADSADGWAHYIHCLSGGTPDSPDQVEGASPLDAKARAAKAKQDEDTARRTRLAGIADRVHEAMEGWGTDEEGVYRALQELDREPAQVSGLMEVYAERFRPDTLLGDLNDDFSGSELEYALQLINMGSSDAPQTVDDALFGDPKEAARRIREAVEGMGTDEEAIFAALLPFRRDTLALQRGYQEQYGEDLRDRIEDELEDSSELEYALDLMETPFERYLNEASSWLRRYPAIGFGLPWSGEGWYDQRYWHVFFDKAEDDFRLILNTGRRPHEAIDALFHEQDRWKVDCSVFVEVVQLYALRQSLGARRFDARVADALALREARKRDTMQLRRHGSDGIQSQMLFKRSSASAAFTVEGEGAASPARPVEEVLAEAPIGSRVRWTSQLLFDRADNLTGQDVWLNDIGELPWMPYIHENSLKLAPDRFAAQGVGGSGRVSRQTIEDTLTRVTAQAFPDRPEAEIRAGIYISEIEIFERPELSEQIEPGAASPEQGGRP